MKAPMNLIHRQTEKTSPFELPYMLQPHETMVVMSNELIGVAYPYYGIVSPRSGLARLPIYFGYSQLIDTGYRGIIGMNLTNLANFPIELEEDIRFCQVMFHELKGKIVRAYNERPLSKYLTNDGSEVPVFKVDKEWLGIDEHGVDKDFVKVKEE
jgi:dCTP deaminase